MLELTVHNAGWNTMFGVPTAVVDQYLKLATPSQLKILLYLLRHCGEGSISAQQISTALNLSEELIEEAMIFWSQTTLFSAAETPLPTVAQATAAVPTETPTAPQQPAQPSKVVAVSQRSSAELHLRPTEIAAAIEKSNDLQALFSQAETSLGVPLNHTEQRILLWLHDYLGFSSEVILTVLSYCISIDKRNLSYMEKMLIRWWNEDITSLQQVTDAILKDSKSREFQSIVSRRLHLQQPPTSKQREYIDQWQQMKLSVELIAYAQEITIDRTQGSSFPYIHKILMSWHNAGCKTPDEAKNFDASFKKAQESNAAGAPARRKKKKNEIPESPMADAYRSLIYNIDE